MHNVSRVFDQRITTIDQMIEKMQMTEATQFNGQFFCPVLMNRHCINMLIQNNTDNSCQATDKYSPRSIIHKETFIIICYYVFPVKFLKFLCYYIIYYDVIELMCYHVLILLCYYVFNMFFLRVKSADSCSIVFIVIILVWTSCSSSISCMMKHFM